MRSVLNSVRNAHTIYMKATQTVKKTCISLGLFDQQEFSWQQLLGYKYNKIST